MTKQETIRKNGEIVKRVTHNTKDPKKLTAAAVELSKQEGFGYINDLIKQGGVNLKSVDLISEKWSFKQEGLTPAGAALIALAVTIATGGAGASASASLSQTAINAAWSSLQTQAAITLVNNKGDIGKTLKALATSETIKSMATAALTAGAVKGVMTNLPQGAQNYIKKLDPKGFEARLINSVITNTTGAVVNFSVNGGSFSDHIEQALLSSLADSAQGFAAGKIASIDNKLLHKLAHAATGCAAASIKKADCEAGAIGAAVAEVVGAQLSKTDKIITDEDFEKIKIISKLVAGTVAAYSGKDAQTAINAGEVALENNHKSIVELQNYRKELKNAKGIREYARIVAKYEVRGIINMQKLQSGLKAGIRQGLGNDANGIWQMVRHPIETIKAISSVINDKEFRTKVGDGLRAELDRKVRRMEYLQKNATTAQERYELGVIVGELGYTVAGVVTGVKAGVSLTTKVTATGVRLTKKGAEKIVTKVTLNPKTGKVTNVKPVGGAGAWKVEQPIGADGKIIVRTNNRGNIITQPNGSVTCGQHACSMVLNTQGKVVKVDEIIAKFPPNSVDGSSPQVLISALRQNGVAAHTISRPVDVNRLQRWTANGKPAIATVQTGPELFHAVVVDGVTTRSGIRVVAIRDSGGRHNGGVYYETVTSFEKRFTGEAIKIK